METSRAVKARRILRIMTSMGIILTALLAIGECLRIYFAEETPMYSAENITAGLKRVLPAAAVSVALIVISCFPGCPASRKQKTEPVNTLTRLQQVRKFAGQPCAEALYLKKKRKRILICGAGVVALCLFYPLAYLLNRENFTSWQLNQMFNRMLFHVLPGVAGAMVAMIIVLKMSDKCALQEIEALKGQPHSQAVPDKKASDSGKNCLFAVRAALVLLALSLVLWGIFNGGLDDVLKKAIAVCTECIGLG